MTDKCPFPPGSRVVGYFRDSGSEEYEDFVPRLVPDEWFEMELVQGPGGEKEY